MRRSANSSRSSRPIRSGQRTGRGATCMARSVGLARRRSSVIRPMTGPWPGSRLRRTERPNQAAHHTRRQHMAQFMDVHSGFFGVSGDQLREAHDRDLAIERDEGVHFEKAWMDPDAGKVFCLATGPSREAVMRIHERAGHPTPEVYSLTVEV